MRNKKIKYELIRIFPPCLRKSKRSKQCGVVASSVQLLNCKQSCKRKELIKRTEIVSSISKSEIEPKFGRGRERRRQQDGGEDSLVDFPSLLQGTNPHLSQTGRSVGCVRVSHFSISKITIWKVKFGLLSKNIPIIMICFIYLSLSLAFVASQPIITGFWIALNWENIWGLTTSI